MATDRTFDLGDYVEVKDRIRIFYELYAQGRLCTGSVYTELGPDGTARVVVQAYAYRAPDDVHPGVGWSWMELPGKTTYTRGSELENTETSAWGRAIASLGILVDKSIASAQEVDNKRDDRNGAEKASDAAANRTTHVDGLVGKAIAQGTQDFELRQHPDKGFTLPFRLKEGRLNQIVLAQGELALQLADAKDTVLGQLLTVWGHYEPQTFPKKDGTEITYNVLFAERIKVPDGRTLPFVSPLREEADTNTAGSHQDWDGTEPIPVAAGQVELPLTDEEKEAIAAGADA